VVDSAISADKTIVLCTMMVGYDMRGMMSKTASARFYRSSKKRVSFQQGVV